ncbi:MAG: UTP--glucose-1-phosphate uridylyltransferase GalU [Patescibacteria group bacterium]|nr:UTP--glucose-1-phosphate uridylyltransferase GalU [Patescibacteria group bacterium]
MKITKAIIPVAGYGTRFLPATKAQPKEMLPVIDKPAVQIAVEEAVKSGITDIILITGQSKRAIEDHFDRNADLEMRLRLAKKSKELAEIIGISELANFIYIRQTRPLGNGHAVLRAESVLGQEAFVVIWPDDYIVSKKLCIKQMIDVYQEYQSSIIGVLAVPKGDITKYGIIKNKHIKDNVHEVLGIIEKPSLAEAPSNLAVLKGYVLTPDIFPVLKKTRSGKGGEIWLADAVLALMKKRSIFACEFTGTIYDLGSKLGWLKANIFEGLKHNSLGPELRKYLKKIR